MSCSRGCCESFAEHIGSVTFGTVPGGARDKVSGISAVAAKQKEWDKDIAAVQSMKKEGIVPRKVDGSDKWLATAKDKIEIEHGTKYSDVGMVKEMQAELDAPKSAAEVKKTLKHNKKILADL